MSATAMHAALWHRCRKQLVPDGSLRDIYVEGLRLENWDTPLFVVTRTYPHAFSHAGGPVASPSSAAAAFAMANHALLTLGIRVSTILVNCHYAFLEPRNAR